MDMIFCCERGLAGGPSPSAKFTLSVAEWAQHRQTIAGLVMEIAEKKTQLKEPNR
jgi:hypothetical protein